MSAFAFLLLCIQVCMVQNIYSQCWRDAIPTLGPAAFAEPFRHGYAPGFAGPDAFIAEPFGLAAPGLVGIPVNAGAYGGSGFGDMAIAGELPVAGTTTVVGQVPILGVVRYGGDFPAAGAVSIAGSSGCGCNRAYLY